jgi:hypothetical protein
LAVTIKTLSITMKFSGALSLVLLGTAAAFTTLSTGVRLAFVALRMSDGEDIAVAPAPAPAKKAAAPSSPGGKMVPIKEETVEFTAGILGGVAGFAIGGPVLGAIGAAIANYASKQENDVSEVVSAVSKSSIQIYNYLVNLDNKYSLLNKAKDSLEESLEKLKAQENVDPEVVTKVEKALADTTSKIKEVNDEYDLVGAGTTALGVVGDLVEKAIKKAGELNEEYKITDKAKDALKAAVDKAQEAAKSQI